MNIRKKIKEERIRYINFSNQTTNKLIVYSNILSEGCIYLKDNGINKLTQNNNTEKIKLIDKENFI